MQCKAVANEAWFKELKERLVASGQPAFSCSEFHELYDYITELQEAGVCNACGKTLTGCTNSDCDSSIG